ncbi:hypothetical protein EMCRGX_G021482 [Ephydatia muelleri]|eukprot:Em0009g164a
MSSDGEHPNPTTCEICSKLLTDPRLLPCLHSFCLKCLQEEASNADSDPQQGVTCVTCGALAILPPSEGVNGFPQNLHLAFEVEVGRIMSQLGTQDLHCGSCGDVCVGTSRSFCSSCYEFLCQSCLDYHKRHRTFKQHEVVTLGEDATTCLMAILKPKQPLCPEPAHEDVLKFYCQTCNKLVCRECTVINHKDHRQVEVASEAEAQRGELRGIVESSTDIEEKLTVAIERGTTMLEFVDTTRQEVTARIDEAFDKLHQALEEKRLSLLATTNDITLYRASQLSTQKQEWEFWYSELNRYVEKSNDILLTHSEEQFVALRKSVQNKLNGIIEKGSDMCFEPNQHSDIPVFIETAILLKEIPQCGFILDYSPSKSIWMQKSLPVSNSKYELFLESKSPSDKKLTNGGLYIKAVLKTYAKDEDDITGEVVDNGDGTYAIVFTPLTNGLHQLCITMNGLHVHNSPCDVEVKGTRTKRGRKVTRNYNAVKNVQLTIPISFPWQVGIHDNGTIYITDIGTLCVHVLDPLGNKKMVIGSTSTAKAQFNSPRGIALKGEVMYVTDSYDHCVHKMTLKGDLLFTFGKHGMAEGQLNVPMGVCMDAEDRVIVANSHNHRVEVFDSDGTFSHSIAGNGVVGKGFSSPWDVAIDPWGNLHIAAWNTGAIKVFTVDGMFVRSYGEKVLVNPRGIAIDGGGYIFVSDGGTGDVAVFDPTGKCVHTIHGLDSPTGVALDQENGIYVVNYGNGTVLRY